MHNLYRSHMPTNKMPDPQPEDLFSTIFTDEHKADLQLKDLISDKTWCLLILFTAIFTADHKSDLQLKDIWTTYLLSTHPIMTQSMLVITHQKWLSKLTWDKLVQVQYTKVVHLLTISLDSIHLSWPQDLPFH